MGSYPIIFSLGLHLWLGVEVLLFGSLSSDHATCALNSRTVRESSPLHEAQKRGLGFRGYGFRGFRG